MIPGAWPTVGQQSACRGATAPVDELAEALLGATEPYWCSRCRVHRVDALHALCPVCADADRRARERRGKRVCVRCGGRHDRPATLCGDCLEVVADLRELEAWA